AALDAQPAAVGAVRAPVRIRDLVGWHVDVIGERAADSAVGAHGLDRLQLGARADGGRQRLVCERTGRAHGRALAAAHAGRFAHRRIEVERDAGLVALAGAADDLVRLQVVAAADAAVAQDAGLVVDRDHGRRGIARARVSMG